MNRSLADLPAGSTAKVHALAEGLGELAPAQQRRLAELGFLPGETVEVLHRGPGGREPLAVAVGDAVFALRLAEARCVLIQSPTEAPA